LVPEAEGRTFTLKELVRLLEALPATPGPGFAERVVRADELRRSGFEGDPSDEDVADPLGMSLQQFQAVAWEIQEWCGRLSPGRALQRPVHGAAVAPAQRRERAGDRRPDRGADARQGDPEGVARDAVRGRTARSPARADRSDREGGALR